MKKVCLFGGLLITGCSALRPPSAAQLMAGQQVAEQQGVARLPIIHDAPTVTRKRNRPLVFVDGQKARHATLNHLVPTTIESTSLIKPPVSTAIYGKRGRYGVIVITTKMKGY